MPKIEPVDSFLREFQGNPEVNRHAVLPQARRRRSKRFLPSKALNVDHQAMLNGVLN